MKEIHLKLIAITALLIAWSLSIAYGLEPTEFAQKVWANENLIKELSDACTKAEDSKHCFGIWLAISNAETQMGKAKTNHWYFGRKAHKDKSAYWFVASYNKYYYIPSKYNEWGLFYGYWPNNPAPTSYCMSETSSNSQWYCPNGRKNIMFIPYDIWQEVYYNCIMANVIWKGKIKEIIIRQDWIQVLIDPPLDWWHTLLEWFRIENIAPNKFEYLQLLRQQMQGRIEEQIDKYK